MSKDNTKTNEQPNKKGKSSHKKKEKTEGEPKDLYFIILYPREQQEKPGEFVFSENSINPQNIYMDEKIQENGKYFYKKVFKFNGKTEKEYNPEFEIGKDSYLITFEAKENSFIYDVELKKGNKILKNITKINIDQKIDFHKKLDIFLEALKKNDEEGKNDALYKDTIDLFEKKKGFSFLISLFVKIYENKELCTLLMAKFKDMNAKKKDNEKNMDRTEELEQYRETFKNISSEVDTLINRNSYDPIQFYAIILCYLNFYDHDNFIKVLQKLISENCQVLYEILLIYFSHFLNPINQHLDFFVNFIDYCASNKEFEDFENGLNYIQDIETFITVINKTKEKIFDKYVAGNKTFKPIKLKANLSIIKTGKEIDTITSEMREINSYSKEKNVLLVYFTSNFWIKILKDYNIVDQINIKNCYELRTIFSEYKELVNKLYEKEQKSEIKKDINKYFERDEFAFILDKNIKKELDNDNELSNAQILALVQGFNPYYKEDKYLYKRDTYIFEYINLDDNNKQFIKTFQDLDFETMFKDKIIEFLNIMTSKIKNISNFGTILELIDKKKISSKINEYFKLLKDKFELIKRQIESLSDKELEEAVEILAKFVNLIYTHENNCDFIKKKIDKLDKKISSLIYNELMRTCKGDQYKEMKELIYQKFLHKLENIDNIIKLIDSLSKEDKKDFLEELMKKCKFTRAEYYSNNDNKKIDLLCELNEKKKIEKTEEQNYNYGEIEKVITQIYKKDLDKEIIIKDLEEFLKNDEKLVKKRLALINLIISDYDPETKYNDLQKIIERIHSDIKELNSIKCSLLIFHRNTYKDKIRDITNIINDIQTKNLENYKAENTQLAIKELKKLKNTYEDIEKVKDFLLFKVLYNEAYGDDQEKRFNEALNQLKEINDLFSKKTSATDIYEKNKKVFNKIKEMLNNESKSEKFFEQMKTYYNIKDNNQLIKDLSLIFKSKMYEIDLKSIIYFFENLDFQKDNKKDEFFKLIPEKYKGLSEMGLEELKASLGELQKNGIYDYEKSNKNYKLFTSFYEKKEAIDFLLAKTDQSNESQDISTLSDRIDPTNRTVTIENIKDTEECIKIFKELRSLDSYKDIFDHIQTKLTPEDISKFEMFSKNYSSIIELERNDDTSLNICQQVNNYIEDATFIFRQDNEDFSYGKEGSTNMEELIHLKNKIHIKSQNNEKKEKEEKEDEFQTKCKKLIFFKKLVSNLEIIYEYMKFLRMKGSSLPILISIKIKNSQIDYILNRQNKKFEDIRDFLFLAKTDYITQLDSTYKQKKYLRFLFGKLFRNIMKHLDGGYDVSDIIRFILNKTDCDDKINDGKAANPKKVEDYVRQYKIYSENSFNNISNYLTSLFEKNNTSLQKHYESMEMKEKYKYKGIYLHKCENESMEEFILNIYWDKMNKLPIAQNVLISCKETSQEEMQAFFYRAILCDYNTLFVVEINDSFSDFMQNIMYTYIDTLLTYKNEKYKEYEEKKKC